MDIDCKTFKYSLKMTDPSFMDKNRIRLFLLIFLCSLYLSPKAWSAPFESTSEVKDCMFYSFFGPPHLWLPKKIVLAQIARKSKKIETSLKSMQIEFQAAEENKIIYDQFYPNNPNEGKTPLFQLNKVPESAIKKKGTAKSVFFTHPDFPIYFEELKRMGFSIGIDPTIGLGVFVKGMLNPSKKMLHLSMNTHWTTFLHEFDHVVFDYTITDYVEKTESLAINLKRFKEFYEKMPDLTDQEDAYKALSKDILAFISQVDVSSPEAAKNATLLEAVKWYQQGIHQLPAIKESTATQRAMNYMKKERINVYSPIYLKQLVYQRSFQLRALKEIPAAQRTVAQEALLKKLKRQDRNLVILEAIAMGAGYYIIKNIGSEVYHIFFGDEKVVSIREGQESI